MENLVRMTLRQARRLIVTIVGTTVVLIGIITLVTPGPAFIIIPTGLAILATEFVWARRLLKRVKQSAIAAVDSVRGNSPSAD